MDIKEKQILVTMISLVLIFVFYSLYVYNHYVAENLEIMNNLTFWARTFLLIIPVTVIAQIIIHIVFAIINKILTNEDMQTKSDERDKLIDLKSLQVAHWVFTGGFSMAMVLAAIGLPSYVMFLTLICSGFASGVFAEIAKLYYYRKGF
jgi:hypothetical protein